jgi:DNA helicase II / ATP-dependent DNA helicase PcrA
MIQLNPEQKGAVTHTNGPMLVVAGAGTGKTKVIIERLVNLVNSGARKSHILCLTFTEKAAQEMVDRASDSLGETYGADLSIYTFNSFGVEMLRTYAVEVGLSSNLQLLGDNGKVVLLREHLDELGLDYLAPVSKPDNQLPNIAYHFSLLKQHLITPSDYIQFANKLPSSDEAEKLDRKKYQELAHAYQKYICLCRENNLIDYDDQIYLLVELLEKRPNVLRELQKNYRYIMVDEFQDTNPMQSKLIDLLAGKNQNLFVVGDDDQSIYGFRGATLSNILNFKKRYPSAKEVTLIRNYRSTQEILDGAHKVIQGNNPNRLEVINKLDKRLIAHKGSGVSPKAFRFSTLNHELNWVADDIKNRLKNKVPGGQIAILARRGTIVDRAHQALEAAGIDHTVSGLNNDLYDSPIVRTMLEALRSIANPQDNQALYHTMSGLLFKLSPEELRNYAIQAKSEHSSLYEVLNKSKNLETKRAMNTLSAWLNISPSANIRTLAYRILVDSGIKQKIFDDNSSLSPADVQALGAWFESLISFERISLIPSNIAYLDNLDALRAAGETISDAADEISLSKPSVMTIHKAKGLEWSVVYIVDATEGGLPGKKFGTSLPLPDGLVNSSDADEHLAEERRLMYVSSTRARDELIVTHSETHNGITKRKSSRFIKEFFETENGEFIDYEDRKIFELSDNEHLDKVALPQSMVSGQNIVLTASQADDYLKCPLNFYYKHVLSVPEEPGFATAVGSLFHELIQQLNDSKLNDKPLPKLKKLLSQIDEQWPRTGYRSKVQLERAKNKGLEAFESAYKRIVSEPRPIAVEEPFRVHLPESQMILKGRIDVLLPLNDGVEIRDYKTSASVNSSSKAKAKTTNSQQLVMYALAWQLSRGEYPVAVSLDFVQTGYIGTVKKQSKTIDAMHQKLSSAAQSILENKFPPGASHDYCIHP